MLITVYGRINEIFWGKELEIIWDSRNEHAE